MAGTRSSWLLSEPGSRDCRLPARTCRALLPCRSPLLRGPISVRVQKCRQRRGGRRGPGSFCRLCARHQYAEFEAAAPFTNVWAVPTDSEVSGQPARYCHNRTYDWGIDFTPMQSKMTGMAAGQQGLINISCVPFNKNAHVLIESTSFTVVTAEIIQYPDGTSRAHFIEHAESAAFNMIHGYTRTRTRTRTRTHGHAHMHSGMPRHSSLRRWSIRPRASMQSRARCPPVIVSHGITVPPGIPVPYGIIVPVRLGLHPKLTYRSC